MTISNFVFAQIIVSALILNAQITLQGSPELHSKISEIKKIAFINKLIDGDKCNTFGFEKYVQNSDANAAYNVTVKVVQIKGGAAQKESQKVVQVPAGGKTYVGCTQSPEIDVTYQFTIVGEVKS